MNIEQGNLISICENIYAEYIGNVLPRISSGSETNQKLADLRRRSIKVQEQTVKRLSANLGHLFKRKSVLDDIKTKTQKLQRV